MIYVLLIIIQLNLYAGVKRLELVLSSLVHVEMIDEETEKKLETDVVFGSFHHDVLQAE